MAACPLTRNTRRVHTMCASTVTALGTPGCTHTTFVGVHNAERAGIVPAAQLPLLMERSTGRAPHPASFECLVVKARPSPAFARSSSRASPHILAPGHACIHTHALAPLRCSPAGAKVCGSPPQAASSLQQSICDILRLHILPICITILALALAHIVPLPCVIFPSAITHWHCGVLLVGSICACVSHAILH